MGWNALQRDMDRKRKWPTLQAYLNAWQCGSPNIGPSMIKVGHS